MPTRRLCALGSVTLLFAVTLIGCESTKQFGRRVAHELQPHRLHRWNQGPGPSSDPHFSVQDHIPELEEKSEPDQ